MSLISAWTIV